MRSCKGGKITLKREILAKRTRVRDIFDSRRNHNCSSRNTFRRPCPFQLVQIFRFHSPSTTFAVYSRVPSIIDLLLTVSLFFQTPRTEKTRKENEPEQRIGRRERERERETMIFKGRRMERESAHGERRGENVR